MRIPKAILLLFVFALGRPAYAWDDTGHMVVAYIAYQDLSVSQRAKIAEILKHHPRYETDLQTGMPEGFDRDLYAFLKAATWPDLVRSTGNPMHFTNDHPAWHFIDYPLDMDGINGPPPNEQWDGNSDPQNILQAVAKCTKQLQDPATTDADRAIALCWVLHLIGDIHQPLHAASRYNKQFPQGDQGGNLLIVRTDKKRLHFIHTGDHIFGDAKTPKAIEKLSKQITEDKKCTRDALKTELADKPFKDWALESFACARGVAYDNGKLTGADEKQAKEKPSQVPELPDGYDQKARDLAALRVALAGYRLTDWLGATIK